MIDSSIKRYLMFGFELKSSHVLKWRSGFFPNTAIVIKQENLPNLGWWNIQQNKQRITAA